MHRARHRITERLAFHMVRQASKFETQRMTEFPLWDVPPFHFWPVCVRLYTPSHFWI